MEQGESKKPFQEPDNGVIRAPGNPLQRPIPPRPPLPDITQTQPIPLQSPENTPFEKRQRDFNRERMREFRKRKNGVSEDETELFTRQHVREPVLSLLMPRFGPTLPLVLYTGLGLVVLPFVLAIWSPDIQAAAVAVGVALVVWGAYLAIRMLFVSALSSLRRRRVARIARAAQRRGEEVDPKSLPRKLRRGELVHIGFGYGVAVFVLAVLVPVGLYYASIQFGAWLVWVGLVIGSLFVTYLIAKVWYGWRDSWILIELLETGGFRISFGMPDNLFFGYNGDAKSQFTTGPEFDFELDTSWPNRLLFRYCGTLFIRNKINGGETELYNVPQAEFRVYAFLAAA